MTKRSLHSFDSFTGDELPDKLTFPSLSSDYSKSKEHCDRLMHRKNSELEKTRKSEKNEDILR